MLKKMDVEKLLDQLVILKWTDDKIPYTKKEIVAELRARDPKELVKSLIRHAL